MPPSLIDIGWPDFFKITCYQNDGAPGFVERITPMQGGDFG